MLDKLKTFVIENQVYIIVLMVIATSVIAYKTFCNGKR